jgi:alkanesulfonate monooxygenase
MSSEETFPELFIAGSSAPAQRLSITQGSCWMQVADAPKRLAPQVDQVLQHGKTAGLRCSIVARPTREEAIAAAKTIAGQTGDFNHRSVEGGFVRESDSVGMNRMFELAETEWLTPYLWTGAVRSHGGPAVALVGSPEGIASGILEYKEIGVSQFIISGWPKLEEMLFFSSEILPLVRKAEREVVAFESAESSKRASISN